MPEENNTSNSEGKYCPNIKCRWKTYGNYRLMIWAWMVNESGLMLAATSIAHNGFYLHVFLHAISAIFIGIPLVYSEICLAQYTNNGVISRWNFLPFLRPLGYGTIYLAYLKTIYLMAVACWYLEYVFYAALDPPPWFSCDDFDAARCMVKKVNVSIFQHCLEAQLLFDDDCGVKTASSWFFDREIGGNNSKNTVWCALAWKGNISSISIGVMLFILSLREEKFIRLAVKLLAFYVSTVILVLLCIALSTSGAWYATKVSMGWHQYHFADCYLSITRGFISMGTGYGIIGYLSRDVPFRSPATMTSITAPLFSIFIILMYSLIIFSGIKTMSYFHGEEENVIEIGSSSYFLEFASISEILSYFDETPVWGLTWFSSIFLCLFANLWILYYFIRDVFKDNVRFARQHNTLSNTIIIVLICVSSWPLLCSDITGAFTDAIEIIQIISSFFFSVALYWIYGVHKHNVDIIFMIGIKASYFWKITWLISPVLLLSVLYGKITYLEAEECDDSLHLNFLGISFDVLVVYFLVAIYGCIVFFGVLIQLVMCYRHSLIRDVFVPSSDWGPRDRVLFKSRTMFVPEIMTREFLYRRVRIHGYAKRQRSSTKEKQVFKMVSKTSSEGMEWSALTSN